MFQFTGTAISTAQYCIPARVQVLPAPCVAAMQHQFPAAILDLLGIPCGHRWPIQHRSPRPLQCDQSQAGRVLERPGCTLFVESRIPPQGIARHAQRTLPGWTQTLLHTNAQGGERYCCVPEARLDR